MNVLLSATVAPSGPGTVNEGTVTFAVFNGATQIGTSVTSGTVAAGAASATYVLPANTAAGTHTIQATYNPGADFTGSSDNTHTLTVSLAPTFSALAPATGTVGSAYSGTISISNGTAPFMLISTTLPGGYNASLGGGTIGGTNPLTVNRRACDDRGERPTGRRSCCGYDSPPAAATPSKPARADLPGNFLELMGRIGPIRPISPIGIVFPACPGVQGGRQPDRGQRLF